MISDNLIIIRSDQYAQQDVDVVKEVLGRDGYWTSLRGTLGPGEIVVDVGAHIGCFSVLWRRKNPQARFYCVEVCPENIPVLTANVGDFATIRHAACTYETEPVVLLNSVQPGGTATGGSQVIPQASANQEWPDLYWGDARPLDKITLEEIIAEMGVDRIDVLKLDCEGSEFSILENCSFLDRIGIIFGEYHGPARWEELRRRKFHDWDYGHMHAGGEQGIFHLVNPRGAP